MLEGNWALGDPRCIPFSCATEAKAGVHALRARERYTTCTKALGTGHWALKTGHWALKTGHWALGTGQGRKG